MIHTPDTRAVLDALRTHATAPFTVSEIADAVNMSTSRTRRALQRLLLMRKVRTTLNDTWSART